jgi:protein-S-isoprenylcysteine O-methyltransferase Ste14
MGVATGMAAFFLATFVAIVVLLFYTSIAHKTPDFAITYKLVGLPVGATVMALSLGFLGVQWAKRMIRKSRRA